MRIMKVLIATPLYPPDIGGPATYAQVLEEEFPRRGMDVSILSFGSVRHFPKGVAHLVYAVRLFRLARSADLILALDPVSVGLPAALVSVCLSKPLVVKVVGDYAWEQGQQRYGVKQNLDEFVRPGNHFLTQVHLLRAVECFVARRAKKIIVPSVYLKGIVTQWGVHEERISVVYNAFSGPASLPEQGELRKKLSLTGTVILSAGRLVPWKGFRTLIGLMTELRQTIPDAHVYIAGGGPLEDELKGIIRDTHTEGFVTMLGNVPRETLLEYVRAADVFVLNTGYEGLSHQLLEVLAVGTPIVTTRVGGNPELIEDGKTGILVPYDDRDALRAGIQTLVTDASVATTLATEGKRFVSSFTKDRMINDTQAVLRSSISS
jgi:glycosyltransferase involved in cell wall biosynthesis